MSIRRITICFATIAAIALLAGCALDPIEEQQEKLDSQKYLERREAVLFLKDYEDDRTVELLVETLEGDAELLEESGNALVLKGREWEEEHPNAKKSEQNPVIEQLSQTIGDMHLEAPVRTKACWALGEIGSRRAIAALKPRRDDPSSMKVRAEAINSLKKLGFYGDAMAREMLGDGEFVETYTEEEREARGLVIVEEEGEEADEAVDEDEGGEAAADDEASPNEDSDQQTA